MNNIDFHIEELEQLKIFMNNKIDLICSSEEYYGLDNLAKYWLPKFNENKDFGKQTFSQYIVEEIKPTYGIKKIKLKIEYKWAEYLCTKFNKSTIVKIIN